MPYPLRISIQTILFIGTLMLATLLCWQAWRAYQVGYAVRTAPKLLEFGKYDEAQAQLEQALKLAPNNAEAHRLLGRTLGNIMAFRQRDDLRKPWVRTLEQAAKLDPQNGENHYELALAYWGTNQNARAETAFRTALERDPYHTEYLFQLGFFFERNGRKADAARAYQASLNVKPDSFVERALTRVTAP